MSRNNEIDTSHERKAIVKALKSMLDKAKAAGIKAPEIFVEGGGTIAIVDPDAEGTTADRVVAQVVIYPSDIGGNFDAGAW